MNYDRPLFSDERGLALMNQYSGGFAIAGIFGLKGNVNPESLRRSLDFLQSSYPRINCRIVGDLKNPEFKQEGTQPIPLELIEESDSLSWRDVVFKEVNTPFPRDKYLLKCFLVSAQDSTDTHYLITIINHSISDGLSFMRMNDLILKYYAEAEKGLPLEQPDLKFPEGNQAIPWQTRGYKAVFSSLMAWIRQQMMVRSHGIQKMTPDQNIPVKDRQGNFVHRCIDLDLSKKLYSRCKQEKAKLNGAASAAMLLSVAQEIPKKGGKDWSLSCQSYVDLRSQTSPRIKDEYMAVMTSSVFSFHRVNEQTSLWQLAQDIDQQIQSQVETGDFKKYPMILGKLIELSLPAPESSTQTLSITNVGRVRVKKNYGDLAVETVSMFPHITVYGNLIVMSMYKFRDQLNLTFSFSYPSLSLERVNRIADRVVSLLQEAVT